jgi:adenosine deaminase
VGNNQFTEENLGQYFYENLSIVSITHYYNVLLNLAWVINNIPKGNPNYYLYNIHHNKRNEWIKVTQGFLNKERNSDSTDKYIFYYATSRHSIEESNQEKKDKESSDEVYCNSKFLRDVIYAHNMGFDIDLSLEGKIFKDEFNKQINLLNKKAPREVKSPKIQDKIISSVQNYFGEDIKNTYLKYVTDYYAYNINSSAFKGAMKEENTSEEIFKGISLDSVTIGHVLQGATLNTLINEPKNKEKIARTAKWHYFLSFVSHLSKLFVYYYDTEHPPKILLIDDHPEHIDKERDLLKTWFFENDDKNITPIHEQKEIDDFFKALLEPNKTSANPINITKYDFVLIDLDYFGIIKGFEYLRILRKFKQNIYSKPYVIVFSRNDDPSSIQKSLDMGALIFSSKQDIAHLILEIFKVLPTLDIIRNNQNKCISINHERYQNWSLLYKLPLKKILELKSAIIAGKDYKTYSTINESYGFNKKDALLSDEYSWIKKLPKADIHCHIGSCMGAELLPKTALLVLAELAARKSKQLNTAILEWIVEFLIPVVYDRNLCEVNNEKSSGPDNPAAEYIREFISDTSNHNESESIFQSLEKTDVGKSSVILEEALLSPSDTTIERFLKLNLNTSRYLQRKCNLREKEISYDLVMLVFILLIHTRENHDVKLNRLETELLKDIETQFDCYDKFYQRSPRNQGFEKNNANELHIMIKRFVEIWTESSFKKDLERLEKTSGSVLLADSKLEYPILSFLQSAHHPHRCLGYKRASLRNYLRGCEYAGSSHLQSKAAILLTTQYVVKNASEENIRYLCLRCAVDGYSKFKLQSQDEAMEALLNGLDFFSEKKGNIHVNVIVTAKKHKSEKELQDNIRLALKYRNGLHLKEIESPKNVKEKGFFSHKSRVVSFDLAGLEKGYRPSRFRNQLQPVLRECFPITIHAGEEDEHEAIWEAVYLLQSQRLGHALTLRHNINLLDMVRERHVTIELCPLSNILTNGRYMTTVEVKNKYCDEEFQEKGNNNLSEGHSKSKKIKLLSLEKTLGLLSFLAQKDEFYPLRQYLDENLDVTINTDNPFISNSTMTKEYIVAASMIGGLTKWEILRLIKNGFRGAAIPKEEKRELMNEIDNEIYEILLNED